jgi:TetR/AcrR family transcriptional regulator, repressor for uid operon
MPAEGKVTTREAKRRATRERLFDAAVGEFKRAGVAEADVGAIVEQAGVAHGTFFFHFPTKEHVLAELGHREEIRLAGELDRFLASPRDLKTTLDEVLRLTASLERRLGSVLFDDMVALYFSPTRPELRFWPDHPLIARVVAEFGLARDRGEIRDDPKIDPANAAIFFFMGFFALLVTYDRSRTRNALLEQSIGVLLRGLEP